MGADKIDVYFPFIQNKRVAVCANHTTTIGDIHLVDSLLSLKINIVKIFCPEHGFRGEAEAGKKVNNSIDKKTGIPIVSLYGSHKKPDSNDLANVDVILFDIQDVGARFYTYISTMHYIMEAAAENKVVVIVLDRPNPNGYWVDGPVLKKEFASLWHAPVPIVHGMTMGEYAKMINGEKWLAMLKNVFYKLMPCKVIITLSLSLPINPSPSLSSMTAIYIQHYAYSKGTPLSIGRKYRQTFLFIRLSRFADRHINSHRAFPVATNVPCQNKNATALI